MNTRTALAPRLNFFAANREAMQAMAGLDQRIAGSELEPALVELVRIRVSQINGCAYCIDRHVAEARRLGESDRKLALLQAWRDAPLFTARERAALAWAEVITRIADSQAPECAWEQARDAFTPPALVDLTLAINAVNAWNRFAIAFRKLPS